MDAAIQIDGVTKRFRDTLALDRVSFTVPRQEIFGLLGPNGAGKTTLMRILIGIFAPDEGCVNVYGDRSIRLKERIGYLPEDRGLYQKMKVYDLLHYCAAIKGVPRIEIDSRIEEGINRIDLTGELNQKVQELSKGNQQRIQLLIALLHKPDILVLDEPFTSLDPIGVDRMKQILNEEVERGATVIISTHRMEDAEQLCKSLTLIHRGRVIRHGTLNSIQQEEGQDRLIVEYQGDPESIQSIPGVAIEDNQDHRLRLRLNGDASIPDVIRELSTRLDVYNIVKAAPTLHDIFVRLVGDQEDPS